MNEERKNRYNRRKFIQTAAKQAAATTLVWYGLSDMAAIAQPMTQPAEGSVSDNVLQELKQYHIVWDAPAKNCADSMPLGGHDTGVNVWVENGDLLFYIQKSGSFDENGEYLKLGRIRVRLDPNPFEQFTSFRQELKLSEGYIDISTENSKPDGELFKTKLRLWVDVNRAVVHVEIESDEPLNATAAYESWRYEDKDLAETIGRERFGCFELEGYPGKVVKRKDQISFTPKGVLFYHRNAGDKLIPGMLIKQQGLEAEEAHITDDLKNRTFGGILMGTDFVRYGTGEGAYQNTPYKSWIIKSRTPQKKHHLIVAGYIKQTELFGDWKAGLEKLASEALKDKSAFAASCLWWRHFWIRSYICIFPGKPDPANPVWQMSRNYQLFRYQLGCNVAGEYPSKFNGGNLTFDPVLTEPKHTYDPDWRAWGGDVFTAQNQRLLYWPMLKSGDFDAITAQFDLYKKALPGATARVRAHFGHKGAMYSEYIGVPGLAIGSGWGWSGAKKRNRGPEIPFGAPEANGLAGYDQPAEAGIMANASIAYHWESQLEHAYMILEYHRFTRIDIGSYMPFIKAAVVFFDEHYRLRQKMRNGKELDAAGKLVIFPSTSCESYKGATNPTDLLAGLKACLKSLLALDEKYVTPGERKYFKDYLLRVPDYSFGENNGQKIIKPAEKWLREANVEMPQFYPLFPFNQFKMEDAEIAAFKNAYSQAPAFRKGVVMSWHQDGIFFARMGMTEDAAAYNTKKLKNSERKFPTFWGPGHDWTPDHNWGGSGMIGLQEMLMQTVDDKIVLLPAWPGDWDVSFKLHAPHETVVEVEYINRKFRKLKVMPASRQKDIILPKSVVS
ncbi:DUF5703 domain-containing protein [Niabella hirudinis]|uniref:DUF5703 domain-containing protein n=1 Tax=Niabella hirudinis TaxID=1285929 RepID=UPI003EB9C43E